MAFPLRSLPKGRRPWLSSDRRLARAVGRPLANFLHTESSGGILILAAAVAALVWANSAWGDAYERLWESEVLIELGGTELFHEDLLGFVNDGLMAIFFLVVGCEIKRELVWGELRDRRRAALPAIAAVGGMIVPALIFVAFNAGEVGARGWGIPMATDIAFAVGLVALLGARVQPSLKLFLLTLAIVDDIGAILVIALFYSEGLSFGWLGLAVGLLGLMVVLRRVRVVYLPVFVILGVAVWYCTLESGVHATIAGVALGLLAPARPLLEPGDAEAVADRLEGKEDITVEDLRVSEFLLTESVPLGSRIENALHPWSSYVIVPIFALANAGVVLSLDVVEGSEHIVLGVVLGLVVGKTLGISLFAWLGARLGLGTLPLGANTRDVVGIAAAAGIGFTVSLFVADLAYGPGDPQDAAKIGILAGSVLAALLGSVLLWRLPVLDLPPGEDDRLDPETAAAVEEAELTLATAVAAAGAASERDAAEEAGGAVPPAP